MFGVPQRGTAYQPGVKPRGMAHNRSVLKERRILPGAPTCFAVAAAWGPLVKIRARRPAGSGRDGVSPSVPWAAG